MSEWKVPVQSLIDHIKTAVDVDKWAKDMAEELLKEQEQRINELEEKLRLLEYGDQDVLQSGMMPAT